MNSWFGKQPDEQMSSGDDLEQTEVIPETDTSEESAGGVPATVEPGPSADGRLALLDQARHAIATAESMDEVKDIRDKAEAARKYAESASLGLEAQNYAAEVKLRAERKAGELIAQLKLHGGDRRSNDSDDRVTLEQPVRLGDRLAIEFKIARQLSNRRQRVTGAQLAGADSLFDLVYQLGERRVRGIDVDDDFHLIVSYQLYHVVTWYIWHQANASPW